MPDITIKIGTTSEVGIKEFAQALARAHSDTQALFFNEFTKELTYFCENDSQLYMQISYIHDSLDNIAIHNFFAAIAQYIEE